MADFVVMGGPVDVRQGGCVPFTMNAVTISLLHLGMNDAGRGTMTGPFRVNDIVGVDHLGRQFLAVVTGEKGKTLEVQPLPRNVTYYRIPKTDVKTMWRMSKGRTPLFKGNCGLIYG